jgi:hypothetical protein
MVSVEDTVKTFLECVNISMEDKTEEEREKLNQIMQKSVVNLCYAIVPESDTLVSDRGIFQAPSPEKASVMKAFFNEQRKAFFGLATGIVMLKTQIDKTEDKNREKLEELVLKLKEMENRVNGALRVRNTALSAPPRTPPTRVGK